MSTKVIIMRGPSGSGKSTLAQKLLDDFPSPEKRIISADTFMEEDGVYKFHPSKLKLCHQRCYHLFIASCALAYSIKTPCLIILDNTNIKKWEFMPYVQVAQKLGFDVEYCRPEGEWNAELFAQRNQHGVPVEKIQEMINNFEGV